MADMSIPAQITPQKPPNMLAGVGALASLPSAMLQIRQMQGQNRLGQIAAASRNADGSLNSEQFFSRALTDPIAAPYAPQAIAALREGQLAQAQLASEQQRQAGGAYSQIGQVLASVAHHPDMAPSLLGSLVQSWPEYIRNRMAPVAKTMLDGLTAPGPDGQAASPAVVSQRAAALAAVSGMNAQQRFAAFGNPQAVSEGFSTAEGAMTTVPGPVTSGQAPTRIPAYEVPQVYGEASPGNMLASGGTPGAPNVLAPKPVQTGPAPGYEKVITSQTGEYADEGAKMYQNAVNLQGRLATMRHDLDTLVSGNPSLFTNPGSGAESRMQLARLYNTALQGLGASKQFQIDPTKVGNMEELMKEAKISGFNFMNSMMGAQREAAQVVQAAMRSIPNAENSPLGMDFLINSWNQLAQRQIDQRYFETNWLRDPKNNGSLLGADETFNKEYPAKAYAERAISMTKDPITGQYVQPYAVKKGSDLKQYLPGTIVKYPDGRLVQVPAQYSGYAPVTLQQQQ